jgi:hypothetical protein
MLQLNSFLKHITQGARDYRPAAHVHRQCDAATIAQVSVTSDVIASVYPDQIFLTQDPGLGRQPDRVSRQRFVSEFEVICFLLNKGFYVYVSIIDNLLVR